MKTRKAAGTDGSLLSSLPWTLVAVGFAIVPHIPYIPIWTTAAFILCAAGRLYIERERKRLPPTWIRVSLAVLCFLGVLATYENVAGVGPGSALLTVMAALKLLETRKRRDQFVLLFISIFLIMSSLLREQYIWSLPYLVAGSLVTMTAWLQMAAGRDVPLRASLGNSGRLMLYALPLTLAMWVFFPRLATPFWAVPVDTSKAVTGLSNEMSPGDISSLSLSDDVAFRVDFDGELPARRELYWRGLVLHNFNGRTWTGNDSAMGSRSRWPVDYIGEPVNYQITMEPTRQHWVYALDVPYEWSLDNTQMGMQQQLARNRPIDQRVAYRAVSYPRYRLDPERGVRAGDYYLHHAGRNPQTLELGERMRAEAGSPREYVEDIMRMFNEEEFYYTLEPPPLGADPVDRFLFDTRRGFCEHYASAFAILMRAGGIPSRVVLGYQGGEYNALGDYLIVRQSDAHAWTEVWLEGSGWTRVDPTAAVAPERIENGISELRFDDIGAAWGLSAPSLLLHRITLTWDAINAKWNEWILGYGPENQNNFMRWLGMDEPDWRQMVLTLVAIVIVMVTIVSLLLIARYRPPKKDEAAVLFQKFVRRNGINPSPGETPQRYGRRLANEHNLVGTEALIDKYLETRYGPPRDGAMEELRSAVKRYVAKTA